MKKILIAVAVIIVAGLGVWAYKVGVFGGKSSSITYSGQQGKTALELLAAHHKVETQTLSGTVFVQSIDGVAAPDTKHFWAYFVNGTQATVSPAVYVTKDGDAIEWKIEATNSNL